jgi:diadenylate cyclase
MAIFERTISAAADLFQRVAAYPWWEVAVELAVIAAVVYVILRFVEGTRAAGALKGFLIVLLGVLLLSRVLGGVGNRETFQRLSYLYDKVLAFVAIALIVIFQPELRRALIRLGEAGFLRATPKNVRFVVDEIVEAAEYLSRARFGAIIAVERESPLSGVVEGGVKLNAELTAPLLQTIFFPGSALHDLGCVVRGKVIDSAGVQFPLAEPSDMPDAKLGSRHRAAVGLTQECDAVVVVVSEETGQVRIAERGKLSTPLTLEDFEEDLTRRLSRGGAVEAREDKAHDHAPPAARPVSPPTTAAEKQELETLSGFADEKHAAPPT